ncbi:MATE efflux family protein 5 [Apostasia shenzhenica]|uniref:MATE efflux family protein 5 n=1 Tax=Apostasia shenzhenica TaxID=1088818 RepID=A0A2I0AW06_9ASPA|nr:MATE efflux family protein 5 [Apostasia shenzhenica]
MEEALLQREEVGRAERRRCGEVTAEARRLGYFAGPMVGVTLSQYLVQVTSSMMVGHLGELSLSSAAIATSLCGVTGYSLLQGMAGALETLCGQAYGAQQYKKVGIHTYRAILSLILVCLPISLIWVAMEKLLSLIGQDPLISLEAGKYAVWMIPGLFAYATVQALTKFLQSQSLILPMLMSSVGTLCVHIPLCWIMVFKTRLANVGAALSISISYWINVLILVLYIMYSNSCKATCAPISKEAFRGINKFLKLAVPSAVMLGVARGCGWQHIGAYLNLGAYYLIGVPIAVVLGFVFHVGGKGLCVGIMCGLFVQTVLLGLITSFTNWKKQVCMFSDTIPKYFFSRNSNLGFSSCLKTLGSSQPIHNSTCVIHT